MTLNAAAIESFDQVQSKSIRKRNNYTEQTIYPDVRVDLDLDGKDGELTGFSNKAWQYEQSGISFTFHYHRGEYYPGSVAAHNMCMCISSDGEFYHSGYFHDSEENQQKLRDLYAKCCSEVFGVSENLMLEKGKVLVEEQNKKKAWSKYCDWLSNWAQQHRNTGVPAKPETFAAWYKNNK